MPEDPARDSTTLPLIRAALDGGVPVLAICRGFQELNVALGGTLDQRSCDQDQLIEYLVADESREKAEALMWDVHNKGRAVVNAGSREEMERDATAMHEYGLWATVQKDN